MITRWGRPGGNIKTEGSAWGVCFFSVVVFWGGGWGGGKSFRESPTARWVTCGSLEKGDGHNL